MAMAMAGAQVRREDRRVQDLGGGAGTFNTAERGHCVPSTKTGCRRQGAHALRHWVASPGRGWTVSPVPCTIRTKRQSSAATRGPVARTPPWVSGKTWRGTQRRVTNPPPVLPTVPPPVASPTAPLLPPTNAGSQTPPPSTRAELYIYYRCPTRAELCWLPRCAGARKRTSGDTRGAAAAAGVDSPPLSCSNTTSSASEVDTTKRSSACAPRRR